MTDKQTVTTNDNRHRFTPDYEYAEQWARDTLSGRSEGGAFSTEDRNLALAYLELLKARRAAA